MVYCHPLKTKNSHSTTYCFLNRQKRCRAYFSFAKHFPLTQLLLVFSTTAIGPVLARVLFFIATHHNISGASLTTCTLIKPTLSYKQQLPPTLTCFRRVVNGKLGTCLNNVLRTNPATTVTSFNARYKRGCN